MTTEVLKPQIKQTSNKQLGKIVQIQNQLKTLVKKTPFMSYARLSAESLDNSPSHILIMSDIYKAANNKHPFYDHEIQKESRILKNLKEKKIKFQIRDLLMTGQIT